MQQGLTADAVGYFSHHAAQHGHACDRPRAVAVHIRTQLDHGLSVDHIVPGRNEQDVLAELLLKLGLDLCVPIENRTIAGKSVHAIGGGVLLACLDTCIKVTDVEPLALGFAEWHKTLAPAGETTCVFRDSAFENDVAKTNFAAILDQHGIQHVRSL